MDGLFPIENSPLSGAFAGLMVVFSYHAVNHLTQGGREAPPQISRLGGILPYFACVSRHQSPPDLSLPEGKIYLHKTIAALLAIGRRDSAVAALEFMADDFMNAARGLRVFPAEHVLRQHLSHFIQKGIAPDLHNDSAIPKDFSVKAVDVLLRRVKPETIAEEVAALQAQPLIAA